MKFLKVILAGLAISIFASNIYSAGKPPANLKDKLATLKTSLGTLKTKLNLLNGKLETLKTQLAKPKHKSEVFSGTSGTWISLGTKIFGNNIGVKIFHQENIDNVSRDLAIEFYTWRHLQNMRTFIGKKLGNLLPEEWTKAPFSDFMYSSGHEGAYPSDDLKPFLANFRTELGEKITKQTKYLIMDNFSSPYTFRLKISASGWKRRLNEEFILGYLNADGKYIEGKMKPFLTDSTRQNEYLNGLIHKLGSILLFYYFMGLTIEDCDAFVIFNPTGKSSKSSVNDLVKATRIKLVDFGECRIFYRIEKEALVPLSEEWYKNAPDNDFIKVVIKNKNKALIEMGGTDTIDTYLGEIEKAFKENRIGNNFEQSFQLLNEFTNIKKQIGEQFKLFQVVLGPHVYDAQIEEILKA